MIHRENSVKLNILSLLREILYGTMPHLRSQACLCCHIIHNAYLCQRHKLNFSKTKQRKTSAQLTDIFSRLLILLQASQVSLSNIKYKMVRTALRYIFKTTYCSSMFGRSNFFYAFQTTKKYYCRKKVGTALRSFKPASCVPRCSIGRALQFEKEQIDDTATCTILWYSNHVENLKVCSRIATPLKYQFRDTISGYIGIFVPDVVLRKGTFCYFPLLQGLITEIDSIPG